MNQTNVSIGTYILTSNSNTDIPIYTMNIINIDLVKKPNIFQPNAIEFPLLYTKYTLANVCIIPNIIGIITPIKIINIISNISHIT